MAALCTLFLPLPLPVDYSLRWCHPRPFSDKILDPDHAFLYIVSTDLAFIQKDILKSGTLQRAHQIPKAVFYKAQRLASL